MPKMSGLDLLKSVRANERFSKIPFMLITAEARKDNIVDAVHAGTDQYIVKPFTSSILGDKIRAIPKRRGET
jgi:two-component system chemotaxis response regulator CheY